MPISWSATLHAPNDKGIVLTDLGSRFATCTYSTSIGAGFDEMNTVIKSPSGDRNDPKIPLDLAGEIIRNWRGMIAKVYIESQLGWQGRASKIVITGQGDALCKLSILWRGHVYDLEREKPKLDASYTEEFSTTSASELIRSIVANSQSIIAHSYENVAETAVNIGAVATSMQDTALSLILNQLKGASSKGIEYAFTIWNPADGPYLIPIGSGPTKYRLYMSDSSGASITWDLSELVTNCVAVFTDVDGNSDASEAKVSDEGSELNGGLIAYRATIVDAVNAEGAEAARDSFLALHEDPMAITGNFEAHDYVSNDEGGRELAGLVRAGEIVVVPDVLPFDSVLNRKGRTWAIESTSYDVFTGALTIDLDQRSVNSLEAEQMTVTRSVQRAVEPGLAHNLTIGQDTSFDVSVDIPNDTDTLVTSDPLEFTAVRSGTMQLGITLEIDDTAGGVGGSTADVQWRVGYALDNEDWDSSTSETTGIERWIGGLAAGQGTLKVFPSPRTISPGKHFINIWARKNAGSYAVTKCKIFLKN